MLELMYSASEQTTKESESIATFREQFVKGESMEDKFNEAIHDSRLDGYKEGVKAALQLFSEVQ